jgi:hypothetical protein
VGEVDIERYFCRQVKARGGYAFKWVSPGQRGVPDRIVLLPGGKVWFVELKAPGGRLSALQQFVGALLLRLGFHYTVIWTKEQVDEWITTTSSTPTQPPGCAT